MPEPVAALGEVVWDLPPLILYPFNERVPPSALLENSKAALMLSGLIPGDGSDTETLTRRVQAGRYSEIRMLFFLGKDLLRWVEQCLEMVERTPELAESEIAGQSFVGLLTGNPPEEVKAKLVRWGVGDYSAIFSRAIGLNTIFSKPPELDQLSETFLDSYQRYADVLYQCYMQSVAHRGITPANFRFSLYASGEYTRMLESEWGTEQR